MNSSHGQFWVKIGWITIILVIFIAGYGLARVSDRWRSGDLFSSPPTWQAGFPLAWKTAVPAQPPCNGAELCLSFQINFDWLNFALDWAFFAAVGYALLGTFALSKKLLLGLDSLSGFFWFTSVSYQE